MTNSARLSGRPSSSAAYNVGDVVDTPDSAIKSWRYLGAGEWEPNDAVRYTRGPGGGVVLSGHDGEINPIVPRWWSPPTSSIRKLFCVPGIDALTLGGTQGGVAELWSSPDARYSPAAVRITTPAGGEVAKNAYAEGPLACDLTLSDVVVAYFFVPPTRGGISLVSLFLGQAGGTSFISGVAENSTEVMLAGGGGVVTVARKVSELTTGAGPKPASEGEYQNYKVLRIQAQAPIGAASGEIFFLGAEIVRKRKSMVCVTSDDGNVGVRDIGCPVFNGYGIPISMYLITGRNYYGEATIPWDDIRRLAYRGNVMCNHTASHSNLSDVSVDAWAEDVLLARQHLIAEGYSDGADHLAWVGGIRTASAIERARTIGLKTARNTLPRGIYGSGGLTNPLDIGGTTSSDKVAATILAGVDLEVSRGGDTVLMFHTFHETTNAGIVCSREVAVGVAAGLRDRVEAGSLTVGTIPDLWRRREAERGFYSDQQI